MPPDVIVTVDAEFMALFDDLPDKLDILLRNSGPGQHEAVHKGLDAVRADNTGTARLFEKPLAENALYGPARIVLSHGNEEAGFYRVPCKNIEKDRHPAAHAGKGIDINLYTYRFIHAFRLPAHLGKARFQVIIEGPL